MPRMQNQIWEQYRMFLNTVSQFYRKNGKITLFDNIQCTTKPTSHVLHKKNMDRQGGAKAGNLYIMEFDINQMGND